jgi:hypothetical protein
MRRTAWWVVLGLVGCGGPTPEAKPRPDVAPPALPGPAEIPPPVAPPARPVEAAPPAPDDGPRFGVAPADVRREGEPATVRAVRTGKHEGYDRVVFELDRVPGFHVGYVATAVRCGSGAPVVVDGKAILEVSLRPAQAHDPHQGQPTVVERSRKPADLGVVRQLEATCDFEGDVTWAIGVTDRRFFRAFELSDPPRLVVDVQHAP